MLTVIECAVRFHSYDCGSPVVHLAASFPELLVKRPASFAERDITRHSLRRDARMDSADWRVAVHCISGPSAALPDLTRCHVVRSRSSRGHLCFTTRPLRGRGGPILEEIAL